MIKEDQEKAQASSLAGETASLGLGDVTRDIDRSQILHKRFNFLTLLSFTVVGTSGWEGIIANFYQSLIGGGPTVLVWSAIGALAVILCTSLILAELASAWPTVAGPYHWAVHLAPKKWKRSVGWIMVWFTLLPWMICCVGNALLAVLSLQAIVIVGVPSYVSQRWHVYLMAIALETWGVACNILWPRGVHWFTLVGFVTHVVCFFAITITYLATTNDYNSPSFVFTEFQNLTGSELDGVAALLGIMPPCAPLAALCVPAYFAEETQNPRSDCSRAIVWGNMISAFINIAFVMVVLFTLPETQLVLSNPVVYFSPLSAITLLKTNSFATTAVFSLGLSIVGMAFSIESVATASRVLISQGRDNAIPGADFLAKLHPTLNTPVNALLVSYVFQICLGALYVGNTTAYFGIVSSFVSYMCLVLLMLLIAYVFNRHAVNDSAGIWKIPGWMRLPVAVVAIGGYFIAIIATLIPQSYPVTAVNMNYTSLLVGAGGLIAGVFWVFYGKRCYQGPVQLFDQMLSTNAT